MLFSFFSPYYHFFFISKVPQLKAWNVKCKCSCWAVWTLTASSVFFILLLFCQSVAFSGHSKKPLHITAWTCFSQGGRGALMSLTSITFAGLHVSAPQSASQNHLRHNGRIVRFTIRCLNFEWLPESLPAATPPRKRSHTKHLNFSKSDSSFIWKQSTIIKNLNPFALQLDLIFTALLFFWFMNYKHYIVWMRKHRYQ